MPIRPGKLYAKVNLNKKTVEHLQYIGGLGLNAELCVTDTTFIYNKFDTLSGQIKECTKSLNLQLLMHLPFYGVQLGCRDYYIRQLSAELIIQAIKRALELNISKGVIHFAMPDNLSHSGSKHWIKTFLQNFEGIFDFCLLNDFTLFWENTWERKIDILSNIFSLFDDRHLAMCLDIAHVYCFSGMPFYKWWETFSEKIEHIHLSDNNLDEDAHLPLGEGMINYPAILSNLPTEYLTFTLENNIQDIKKSLLYLKSEKLYIT